MQSAKSGVSRVLGLPTKLIRMPEAHIRRCHVLTVTPWINVTHSVLVGLICFGLPTLSTAVTTLEAEICPI